MAGSGETAASSLFASAERPKRVTFETIEDESGTVNLIFWPYLVEQQRKELMGAKLLGV